MSLKSGYQRKEKAAAARDNTFGLLFELMRHIPDVIYFKDRAGRLILVNDAHAKGLGLKPEEVVGKTDFDIFPKERAELMVKDDRYVMETGKPIIDKVERSTRPDGVDNYVSTTKIPRYDEKGRISGLIGITRDITRRMQFEHLRKEKELIEKKLEALEELNRIKSEFISVVSHELRTPLAIIKEAVLLLLDEVCGGLNDKQREMLLKAKNNIGRLAGIINELLDISRIESGRIKLHYSLVNVNGLLRESSDFFKKMADGKGITLTYALPKEQINIFLDSDKIHQVVSNLINNAIKFTEEDGSVKVELKVLEDRVRIGVMDTGIGIARKDLDKLFNKFTQVSGSPEKERKGLGLGLSIAKDFIARHGGEIWAESRLGVGSQFYFTLPRLESSNSIDSRIVSKINNALAKGQTLYYVNLKIVNYNELKKKMFLKPKKLFSDVEGSIRKTFSKYFHSRIDTAARIVLTDSDYGECSFLLPAVSEAKAERVCKEISKGLHRYFQRNKFKNIFITLGVMAYPQEGAGNAEGALQQRLSANLKLRKMYIGCQTRKARRLRYKADIQILLPKNKRVSSQTIDISRGGLSFYSPLALRTDRDIETVIGFPKNEKSLALKGRIAWIREILGAKKQYRIGLEFIGMHKKEEGQIAQLLKLPEQE